MATQVKQEAIPGNVEAGYRDYKLHDLVIEKIATDGLEETQKFLAMVLNTFNDRLARRVTQ
jgi:hypothetical protein